MEKTINFRQVEWFGQQMNLPALIHSVLGTRPNVEDTVFQRGGETFEVRHRAGNQHEMRLHLAAHIPGARKAVTPRTQGTPAADLSEATPPANTEFTEREIALVIRPDKLGYVVAGVTLPKKVESAMRGLLALGHGADVANRLVLSARADAAMITALLQQGVDRLDFGLVLPSADADAVVAGQPLSIAQSLGRAISDEILTRITRDFEAPQIEELEEMTASLQLKLRKRNPTAEQVRSLTSVATEAIEGDEGFRIRTLDGVEFTRDKLLLKASFDHPNNPATLAYSLAWSQTVQFLDQH